MSVILFKNYKYERNVCVFILELNVFISLRLINFKINIIIFFVWKKIFSFTSRLLTFCCTMKVRKERTRFANTKMNVIPITNVELLLNVCCLMQTHLILRYVLFKFAIHKQIIFLSFVAIVEVMNCDVLE